MFWRPSANGRTDKMNNEKLHAMIWGNSCTCNIILTCFHLIVHPSQVIITSFITSHYHCIPHEPFASLLSLHLTIPHRCEDRHCRRCREPKHAHVHVQIRNKQSISLYKRHEGQTQPLFCVSTFRHCHATKIAVYSITDSIHYQTLFLSLSLCKPELACNSRVINQEVCKSVSTSHKDRLILQASRSRHSTWHFWSQSKSCAALFHDPETLKEVSASLSMCEILETLEDTVVADILIPNKAIDCSVPPNKSNWFLQIKQGARNCQEWRLFRSIVHKLRTRLKHTKLLLGIVFRKLETRWERIFMIENHQEVCQAEEKKSVFLKHYDG